MSRFPNQNVNVQCYLYEREDIPMRSRVTLVEEKIRHETVLVQSMDV